MNIAIYARVSSASQTKDGTIQSQLEVLRDYAKTDNLTILEECIDDGFSGADLNRPGMDHLRDLALEGFITGILVLSPDRLARKQAHQIILMEEFKKREIQVIFSNMQIGDSAEDQLLLQIQGAIDNSWGAMLPMGISTFIKRKKSQVIGKLNLMKQRL